MYQPIPRDLTFPSVASNYIYTLPLIIDGYWESSRPQLVQSKESSSLVAPQSQLHTFHQRWRAPTSSLLDIYPRR